MKGSYLIRGIGIGILFTSVLFFFFQGNDKSVMSDEDIIKKARELGMVTLEEVNRKNLEDLKNEVIKEETESEKKENMQEEEKKQDEIGKEVSTPSNEKEKDKTEQAGGEEKETETSGEKREGNSEGPNSEEGKNRFSTSQEKGGENQAASGVAIKTASETAIKTETKSTEKRQDKAKTEEVIKSEKETKKEDKKKAGTPAVKEYHYTVRAGSSAVTLCNDLQKLGLIKDAKDFNTYLANNDFARRIRAGSFTFYSNEDYLSIATKLISRQLNP